MERQKLALSIMFCTLLFSYGSVAGTHVYPNGLASQSVPSLLDQTGMGIDSALIASNDQTNVDAVAEFARQVSAFQHDSTGGFRSKTSLDSGHLPRNTAQQHDLTAIVSNPGGIMSVESGTLFLITLGFAALALSRRRIKFAAIADGQASGSSNNAATDNIQIDSKPAQCNEAPVSKPNGTETSANTTAKTTPVTAKTAQASEKNPYPELAQSVQKLEALADEMTHYR